MLRTVLIQGSRVVSSYKLNVYMNVHVMKIDGSMVVSPYKLCYKLIDVYMYMYMSCTFTGLG